MRLGDAVEESVPRQTVSLLTNIVGVQMIHVQINDDDVAAAALYAMNTRIVFNRFSGNMPHTGAKLLT